MKKLSALSVAIPRPCGESWTNMTTESSGGFCSSCHKSVIDFARLTDAEVVSIFNQSSGKICGRFNPSQLNRIIANTPSGRHIALPAAVLTALLMTNSISVSAAPASGVATLSPMVMSSPVNETNSDTLSNPVRVITGKVSDSTNGDQLMGVVVLIKGTKRGAITDNNGRFQFEVPDSLRHQAFILECSYLGYKRMERKVNIDEKGNIDLALHMNATVLGEVDVVCVRKATFKERIGAKWRRFWR